MSRPSSAPGLVCAHVGRQQPRTRPFRVAYADVMADVLDHTQRLARQAVAAGVQPERIVIDAAHDFGKNTWHSLEITRRLGEMTDTGWPVLVSLSNKDFVGETLDLPPEQRLPGTLGGHVGVRMAWRPDLPCPPGDRVTSGRGHGRGHSRRPAAGQGGQGTGLGNDHDRRLVPGTAAARPRAHRRRSGPARAARSLPGRDGRAPGRRA